MSDTYTDFKPSTGIDRESLSNNGYGMVQYGPSEDKLIVGFYRRSMKNPFRSVSEGKPVYESKDYVKIQHPGESLNIVDRPVQDTDKQRWPRQWGMYLNGKRQVPDGIPISLLFPAKPEIADTLRGYNIHTVEQLANLSGDAIGTVGMGAQDWVNGAKKYIEHQQKGVNHHQFQKAMEEKDRQIGQLQRQVQDLINTMKAKSGPQEPADLSQFDAQTEQINATHQSNEPFTPEAANFVHDLAPHANEPRKGGWPKGKPRKPKENV